MTSHHSGHILFTGNKALGPAHTQGRCVHTGLKARRQGPLGCCQSQALAIKPKPLNISQSNGNPTAVEARSRAPALPSGPLQLQRSSPSRTVVSEWTGVSWSSWPSTYLANGGKQVPYRPSSDPRDLHWARQTPRGFHVKQKPSGPQFLQDPACLTHIQPKARRERGEVGSHTAGLKE